MPESLKQKKKTRSMANKTAKRIRKRIVRAGRPRNNVGRKNFNFKNLFKLFLFIYLFFPRAKFNLKPGRLSARRHRRRSLNDA